MGTTSQQNSSQSTDDDNLLYFPVPKITKAELDKVGRMKVVVNEEDIALFSNNNKLYAVHEKCPHNGGPLHQGDIEDLPDNQGVCVRCPWHAWKFDLVTGKCVSPKNRDYKFVKTFPTRLDSTGQIISIGFEKISPEIFKQIPP